MGNQRIRESGPKPLSARAFAEHLLDVVRQREAEAALRAALRTQLAMPHVTRCELRLLEDGALVVAAGATRRLDARRPGAPLRVPADLPALSDALAGTGPRLVPARALAALAPPPDGPRCCLAPLVEGGERLGLSLSFWDHPPSETLDERLLAREEMLAGHLALALVHARLFRELAAREVGGSRPGADAEAGERPLLTAAALRALERRNLIAALEASGGKVSGPGGAAEKLGMNASTLASRIRALGLRRGDWGERATGGRRE